MHIDWKTTVGQYQFEECEEINKRWGTALRNNIGPLADELRLAQEYCLRGFPQECCPGTVAQALSALDYCSGNYWFRDYLAQGLLGQGIVQSETAETGKIFYVRCACYALKLHK
jgi:hypothetical protein